MDGRWQRHKAGRVHKRAGSNICEHTHTHSLPPLSHRNRYKSKRDVWDKKKVKPHRTIQGRWSEIMNDGWQMAKAEWMAGVRETKKEFG